jgi:osmoprotectant transport system ATP-binding protein
MEPGLAIELDAVTVRFGSVIAVDAVSLGVAEGELLAIVGGSGSGKTSVLKTVNRLVEPSGGSVRVEGREVRELVPHELRRTIGYCIQRVGLFPHLTVDENVGITPRLLGWPPDRTRKRVEELLALVGLEGYGKRMPRELSGGQEQRVGVARALAAEPKVMLFDEPFGALDPITREQLQDELAEIRERVGLSGIFVTHDITEAILVADRIAVMRSGRLLQVGTARELASAPADDYVARLLSAPARMRDRIAPLLP